MIDQIEPNNNGKHSQNTGSSLRKSKRPMQSKPAAIILCGGESQRMGFPKWQLPFGEQSLLQRLVAILRPHVTKVVLSIHDQPKSLFADIDADKIVADQFSGSGPLEGIRCSLESIAGDCESAFVTACDVPLLNPKVISKLHELLTDDFEAVIPVHRSGDAERVFGMTAVYRTSTHGQIKDLIENKQLKVSSLASTLKTRIVTMDQMRAFDPNLDSLSNINFPADYFEVLEQLELSCTDALREQLETSGEPDRGA